MGGSRWRAMAAAAAAAALALVTAACGSPVAPTQGGSPAPSTTAAPSSVPSTTSVAAPAPSMPGVTVPWPTSSIAGYPPSDGQVVEALTRDLMRWVYEPYRRWAFTGVRVPVIGDCLRAPCAFPIDDLVGANLLARLRREATRDVDPFICRAEPVEVLVDNPVADDRTPLAVVSLSGDASEVNGGTNRVTMVVERSSGRLADVVCSEDPVPPDQRPPLPVASGARHTVAEGLELLWEVYDWVPGAEPPHVPRECGEASWRSCPQRSGAEVLSAAMQARQDAAEGYDIVTCSQNLSITEARGAVTLTGHLLTVELRTHWGGPPTVATVDLDTLLLTDVVCPGA